MKQSWVSGWPEAPSPKLKITLVWQAQAEPCADTPEEHIRAAGTGGFCYTLESEGNVVNHSLLNSITANNCFDPQYNHAEITVSVKKEHILTFLSPEIISRK